MKKPAAAKPAEGTATAAPKPKGSFLKQGKDAMAAFETEHKTRQMQMEQNSKPFRFFITQDNLGNDVPITFLDGDLDAEGELTINSWTEHFVNLGTKWESFVCLAPDYCPMCAGGDSPSVVAAFTIIDHSVYIAGKGKNVGKEYKDQKRLFVAKYQTLKQLSKIAQQHDGLRGMRMTVCRTTKNQASVGDMFTPEVKYDEAELHELFGKEQNGKWRSEPFDYTKAAPVYTLEQLKEHGIGGKGGKVVGAGASSEDVEQHL
jgi:hypothetical protein